MRLHTLAAQFPLALPTIDEAVARMPEAAKKDMVEWNPGMALKFAWNLVFEQLKPLEEELPDDPSILITDDRPYNEYFLLRRTFGDK